jgi:hypothetical protein
MRNVWWQQPRKPMPCGYLEPMGSQETNPFRAQDNEVRRCDYCGLRIKSGQRRCDGCGAPQ